MLFFISTVLIAVLVTICGGLAIVLIMAPGLIPPLTQIFTGNGMTVATIGLSIGTFWLVCATSLSIHNQNTQEAKNRKQRLLHELRDWITEIKSVSFIPITNDNVAFFEQNTSLRYGVTFCKLEYFEMSVPKTFRDADFKDKVSNVGEMLVATMVLGRTMYLPGILSSEDFEAFPGYTRLKDQLLKEHKEKQVELQNKIEEKGRIGSKATEVLWSKYVTNLANAESILISKLTDIESTLL